jgi:hypothetical protein
MKATTKRAGAIAVVLALMPAALLDLLAGQTTPRQQPGAAMTVYTPSSPASATPRSSPTTATRTAKPRPPRSPPRSPVTTATSTSSS